MVAKGDEVAAEPEGLRRGEAERFRSVAQLDMLHSLAAELNSLGDVWQIGAAITGELRTIIDYHSCRVYLLQPDRSTLLPVSFRGEIFSDYEKDTVDTLMTEVGEGITGHVAESRRSLLTPDAREVEFAVTIPGTDDVLESMLAVPMEAGEQLVGVIVLSMLGYGKFDEEDQRLLEVLASHAAVAFENAALFQAEREAAETSASLLRLSQTLTQLHSIEDILQEALDTVPHLVSCGALAAYLRDEESGGFTMQRVTELEAGLLKEHMEPGEVPADVATPLLLSNAEPFVLLREIVEEVPSNSASCEKREMFSWPRCAGSPRVRAPSVLVASGPDEHFTEQDLRLARGIADSRRSPWGTLGASPSSSGSTSWSRASTRSSGRRTPGRSGCRSSEVGRSSCSAPTATDGSPMGIAGGITSCPRTTTRRIAAVRTAADAVQDQSLEYRVSTPDGRTVWIRDMVHVLRSPQETASAPRAHGRHHRTQAGGAGAPQERAEVLGGVPAGTGGGATAACAGRHEEHVPGGRVARPPDPAHVDPRFGAHARADAARAPAGRRARPGRQDRRERPQARAPALRPARPRSPAAGDRRARSAGRRTSSCSFAGASRARSPTEGRDIEVDVESIVVSVDAAKVERILENLLSNAIRHTPRGHPHLGQGVRPGRRVAAGGRGRGSGHRRRSCTRLSSNRSDRRPGSSSEHSPGVGVGLSLVRRFAELHGGRAWIEDRPGGGSSFHVFLPGG